MNITKIFWQIIHYPLNNTTYDTNQPKNYRKTRRHTRIPSRKYLIFTQIAQSTQRTASLRSQLSAVPSVNIPEVHASETMRALCSLCNLCETKDR